MPEAPRLPSFVEHTRLRPVDLVAPGQLLVDLAHPGPESWAPTPHPAPYAAVVVDLDPSDPGGGTTAGGGPVTVRLTSGTDELSGSYDGRRATLAVTTDAGTTRHASRRHGRPTDPVDALGLTLTGTHLTVFTRTAGTWTARGRHDLADRVPLRSDSWLAGLHSGHTGPATRLTAGGFGQLGLRDLRLVTELDGTAYRDPEGRLLLTATSAGPGFFDTAHASVWSLDPDRPALTHRADLFTRRTGDPRVYGDHACHLVRDGDSWLLATSTWGDFAPDSPDPEVGVALARTEADLLSGRHVLDTRPLALPVAGLDSVGTWDPHLVRDPATGEWLVGFVSATAFFRFHPALASGPDLDELTLRGAARERTATEGTTLVEVDGRRWVLASDGRDGPRAHRAAYPVLDLELSQVGTLAAPYPSNLPWPTLCRTADDGWLLVTFDGTPAAGPLPGYGTHGDVVLMRSVAASLEERHGWVRTR